MASTVYEYFGYPTALVKGPVDLGDRCPFLDGKCEKVLRDGTVAGVCSLKPATTAPVICCPNRLYGANHAMLRYVAEVSFGAGFDLSPGPAGRRQAAKDGRAVVAVFGKKWGGELRLPKREGRGGYFVDWVLALIQPSGALTGFVAIEVQTIDTTGNYRNGMTALRDSGTVVPTTAGLNWENVNKRIIPQLIYKGQVLEREPLCTKGLFFVCPTPVYRSVMERLGGVSRVNDMPMRGNSLNFVQWDYEDIPGVLPLSLAAKGTKTTSVSDVWQAFHGSTNLPPVGVYSEAIKGALSDVP